MHCIFRYVNSVRITAFHNSFNLFPSFLFFNTRLFTVCQHFLSSALYGLFIFARQFLVQRLCIPLLISTNNFTFSAKIFTVYIFTRLLNMESCVETFAFSATNHLSSAKNTVLILLCFNLIAINNSKSDYHSTSVLHNTPCNIKGHFFSQGNDPFSLPSLVIMIIVPFTLVSFQPQLLFQNHMCKSQEFLLKSYGLD